MRGAWLPLVCILAACGGDDEPADQDLSGVAGDLSPAPDLASPPDLLPPRTFRVNFIVTSSFLQAVPYGAGCDRLFIGACELLECPAGTDHGYVAGESIDDAGIISAMGGGGTLSITAMTDGRYGATSGGPVTTSPGTSFVVAATGGEVAPFSTMVTTPPTSSLTSTVPTTVARTADLTLGYMPAAGTEILVNLSQPEHNVICFADGAAGTITIPAMLMGHLAVGTASFGIFTEARQDLSVGAWSVQVRAARQLPSGSATINVQ